MRTPWQIAEAVANANVGVTKLPQSLLELEGMSSPRVRILLNELCASEDCHYLEIGAYKGATALAASYGNPGSFTAIEDFSEFDRPRNTLLANLDRWWRHCNLRLIESDCWMVQPERVKPVNVFFYDGSHSENEQQQAFTHFDSAFADEFIAVVDDWNASHVRRGTRRAFADLRYTIAEEHTLHSRFNGDADGWWNGVHIARIGKPIAQ